MQIVRQLKFTGAHIWDVLSWIWNWWVAIKRTVRSFTAVMMPHMRVTEAWNHTMHCRQPLNSNQLRYNRRRPGAWYALTRMDACGWLISSVSIGGEDEGARMDETRSEQRKETDAWANAAVHLQSLELLALHAIADCAEE